MKVISLSQLRPQLFKMFFVLRDTGGSMEVSYRRKIYRINVEDTGKRVTKPYRRRKVNPIMVTPEKCPDCHSLAFNGLCINLNCDRSKVPAAVQNS